MEANSKKHRFRKGRSATFSIDGFNITIGKNASSEQSASKGEVCLHVSLKVCTRGADYMGVYESWRQCSEAFGTNTETSLNTSSHFSLSAQFSTLVHSTEVAARLCTPWKQGDFRLKLCAADVTGNSFYCLDNRSVNELMCHLPFLVGCFFRTCGNSSSSRCRSDVENRVP